MATTITIGWIKVLFGCISVIYGLSFVLQKCDDGFEEYAEREGQSPQTAGAPEVSVLLCLCSAVNPVTLFLILSSVFCQGHEQEASR